MEYTPIASSLSINDLSQSQKAIIKTGKTWRVVKVLDFKNPYSIRVAESSNYSAKMSRVHNVDISELFTIRCRSIDEAEVGYEFHDLAPSQFEQVISLDFLDTHTELPGRARTTFYYIGKDGFKLTFHNENKFSAFLDTAPVFKGTSSFSTKIHLKLPALDTRKVNRTVGILEALQTYLENEPLIIISQVQKEIKSALDILKSK